MPTSIYSFYTALQTYNEVQFSKVIDDFWRNHQDELENVLDIKTLKRGALLAQDEENLRRPGSTRGDSTALTNQFSHHNLLSTNEKTLTQYEFNALKREKAGKMSSVTKDLWVTLATCAVGAVVQ